MVFAAVIFRTIMLFAGYLDTVAFSALPIASFDALAVGSLVAIYHNQLNSWIARPILVAVTLFVFCFGCEVLGDEIIKSTILPTLWLLPLAVLALAVLYDRTGLWTVFLKCAPLVFLGRISLGIYLLHMPVWQAAFAWMPWQFVALVGKPSPTTFLIMVPITLACATCSWLLFEKPLQRLRKYFPYPTQVRSLDLGRGVVSVTTPPDDAQHRAIRLKGLGTPPL